MPCSPVRLPHPPGLAQDVGDRRAPQFVSQGSFDAAVGVIQHGPDASADGTLQVGLGVMHKEQWLLIDGVVHIEQIDLLRRPGQTPARPGAVSYLYQTRAAEVAE